MKEGYFEERGIAYRISELRPGLPTLVFVHGLSGSSSAWYPYEERFEREFNILTLDLRGHGKSQKQFFYNTYAPELMADDLVALLSHLGIKECILIGHSFGTLIALAAIRQVPKKFAAAIFLSPTYGASAAWWLPFGFVIATAFGLLALLLPFDGRGRGRLDYSKYAPTGDWSLRRIAADIKNTSVRVYVYCMRQIYSSDTDEWWRALKIPTLIVHGGRDTVISPQYAQKLHALIPDSKLVLLPRANHILVVNNVEEVASAIKQFVR